jgi:signal transduction histidine kinase
MASAPSDLGPVTGRVDREGRLTSADPPLLRLQQEAGSKLGAPIALPQLAAVARSAMKLGVPLSRAVIAASRDQDLDLWVRAEPDADGATLTIDGWKARPPAPPRLTLVGSEPKTDEDEGQNGFGFATDAELKFARMDERVASRLGLDAKAVIGQPLTRYLLLTDNGDGVMPLLTALVSRQDFIGQRAKVRGNGEIDVVLNGVALKSAKDGFGGYEIEVEMEGQAVGQAAGPIFDPALDEALRSPLDRIIAAAERIVDRSEGPLRNDYAAYAGDIAAAGRHLVSVIKAMTEQEATRVEGRVDLAEAANEAIQLVETRAEERSIQFELVGTTDPLPANGEPRGVVQILVNLLGNAVRHSPEHGTIAVIGERRDDMVAVTIADEGPGIAAADHERIFERYERVGDAPGGIGLGLAISRRLARSMGGDIQLQSAPGEGARFTLVLSAV